jgi:hypothetical protein
VCLYFFVENNVIFELPSFDILQHQKLFFTQKSTKEIPQKLLIKKIFIIAAVEQSCVIVATI